jgi:anti-sigma factor RsiW
MSDRLSARDLERVSAYLDNALSEKDRAAFELRLKSDPELFSALSALRETRALLRRVPQKRAPRSFAIRADMLQPTQKAMFGGWSSLNLVSAAASLVLVLVFAGDIWAHGVPFGAAAPAAEEAPQALMAEEAGAEDTEFTPTLTFPPAEGAGEIELYADEVRQAKEVSTPFDVRTFLVENARPLEFGLAIIALVSGFAAWRRKRKS